MPETFPILDRATGERVPTDFLTLAEVAAELHVSESYVRARVTDPDPAHRWDSLELARRRWMSWPMVADALEMQMSHHAADAIPEAPTPAKLGTPVDDVDLEPITRPVPDPEAAHSDA